MQSMGLPWVYCWFCSIKCLPSAGHCCVNFKVQISVALTVGHGACARSVCLLLPQRSPALVCLRSLTKFIDQCRFT